MLEEKNLHILLAVDGSLHSDLATKLITAINWPLGTHTSILAILPECWLIRRTRSTPLSFRVRWWLDSCADTRREFYKVNTALYTALNEAEIELFYQQIEMHLNLFSGESF